MENNLEPQNKGLLTRIGEAFDQHRLTQSALPPLEKNVTSSHSRLHRFLPTLGNVLFTFLLIGGLLFAQNSGALTLFAAPNAQTASTGTIAYQGRLADADGNALTDTVNMSFRLYSAATSGAPLWEEQWTGTTSVQVSDGLFNVMLGSVAPIPQDVITGNSNLFLGITVGTDGEMSPRVQLGSVPFATQALTVPDGSMTSRKVKLSHGEAIADFGVWRIELTAEELELAGTSTTITVDTPQTLLVHGTFDFSVSGGANSGGPAIGYLYVNGARQAKSAVGNTGRVTVGQNWIVDLDAGTHTLYLAAKKSTDSGTATVAQTMTNLVWFAFGQ